MVELGKLSAVNPRSVWAHEALDFTPWLLENADALADVLGIDLELSASEYPVGGYSLDLFGHDVTNDCPLIVENQLEGTDHSHLGQILTYAAGTDAKTVVWIATHFREEHRQALDWLNSLAGESARFFGIELAVVKIGDSVPAPLLRLRAQPNDWHAQVVAAAKSSTQVTGKGQTYLAFWAKFLERVHEQHPDWTKSRTPQTASWITMPSKIKGTLIGSNFAQGGQIRTELYIDTGDADANTSLLTQLRDHRQDIEAAFGSPLSWEDLEGRRACRIAIYATGDAANQAAWDQYIDWFFDTGTRLRLALAPYAGISPIASTGDTGPESQV